MNNSTSFPTLSHENADTGFDNDKKVKRGRSKSAPRTASFFRAVMAVRGRAHASTASETSVSTDFPNGGTFKGGDHPRRRFPLWYERQPDYSPIRHRALPQWCHLSAQGRAQYFHWALAELGEVHSFSLDLRHDIEAHARLQPKPLDWLKRRVDRCLKDELGRPVNALIVIEETDDRTRRLHLHGEFGIALDEVKRARKALRRAGGEWVKTRQHQVHTSPNPDSGWIAYCGKNFWKTTPFMRDFLNGSRQRVTFNGGVLAYSKTVNRKARELFATHRTGLLRNRREGILM